MDRTYTDKEIIRGCIKGNSKYQRALVMQYSEQLNATALRYIKDPDSAKDVLQDAFMRIFKYLPKYDPTKGKLSSWMCKIVINQALSVLRSSKKQVAYDEYFDLAAERPVALDDLEVSYIYQLITELDDPYRTVFNLNVIEGYPHKDIAAMLDIKIPSSRTILHRAKQMVKNRISSLRMKESFI